MNDISVIKIGGSLITNKYQSGVDPTFDGNKICQILEMYSTIPTFVLTIGVGSFGHNRALDLGLSCDIGIPSSPEVEEFIRDLHAYYNLVLNVLSAMCRIEFIDIRYVSELEELRTRVEQSLHHGFVPVMFGSLIKDLDDSVVVLSSDLIAVKLAVELNAKSIVYFTSEGGIEMMDGSKLNEFEGVNSNDVLRQMMDIPCLDATNAMRGKVEMINQFGFKNRVILRNI